MDPTQIIVEALVKGAAPVAKDLVSEACKTAYKRLKEIFLKSPTDVAVLQEPAVLQKKVEALDLKTLTEASSQAQIVLQHLQPTLNQQAYSLNIDGDVGQLIQGSNASVSIVNEAPTNRKKRRRPR